MFDNLRVMTDLDNMSNEDLLLMRDRINTKLDDLTNIDLEKELVSQFMSTKQMLIDVRDDLEVPPNQKAVLVNACSALLAQLTKSQHELYSSERVKIMEATLIEILSGKGQDLVQEFLAEYETRLEGMK